MKTNEGNTDRILRVILGLVILGIGYWMKSWWGAIGLVPLITGAIGTCPIYSIFGISTCKLKGSTS
ncbi:MAG: DUF2892 domain-containing protein [FCB group bacterium]|nr:DUF2892 domain-containing protein [FCB group bacterium]